MGVLMLRRNRGNSVVFIHRCIVVVAGKRHVFAPLVGTVCPALLKIIGHKAYDNGLFGLSVF